VRALGVQSNTERYYAAADVVASSSAFGEGFSNALAEGMSAGLVPVTTNVGDAARIVGPIGIVVVPRDPAALAGAIRSIADLSGEQRRVRGQEARARIVSFFERERAIDAYAGLYRELAAESLQRRTT
jgi:glycosyltransferase involved in cell wall biosynthesis